ncbi:hypothetical protein ACHAWF_002613 [Thalassiosira exigua]
MRPLLTYATKLKSQEEYWIHRIHALLGGYVLCHFILRYGVFFFFSDRSDDNDMGFGGPAPRSDAAERYQYCAIFVGWFLPHLLLQVTGFSFSLPLKRHPDGNRIWPQYRHEALVFCLRCLTLAFLALRRKENGWRLEDGSCSVAPAAVCVAATMMAADRTAQWYRSQPGTEGSRTIRDLTAPRWAQYMMSSAQFHATTHCLLTSDRLSVQIAALTVVQLSAFGMTLRRKGFISQREGVLLYALVLAVGMIVIFDDLRRRSLFNVANILGNATAVLRMYCGMNKYIMWSVVVVVLTFLLNQGMLRDDAFPTLKAVNISSWIMLLISCYWKHR